MWLRKEPRLAWEYLGRVKEGVKEGANCASGGHAVNQILGRSPCTPPTSTTSYTDCGDKGGGVTFKDVTVPLDGTYDVTFWYHSGGPAARKAIETRRYGRRMTLPSACPSPTKRSASAAWSRGNVFAMRSDS